MSICNLILEGLQERRQINESRYEDTPTSSKSRELQKILSDGFSKKYLKELTKAGLEIEGMGVEVYVHDDDDSMVDDAIYEVTLYIAFDIGQEIDSKDTKAVIDKVLKKYPKFVYDKHSNQFYYTAEEYEDIIDVIDTLQSDGCKTGKFFEVIDSRDIEDNVERQMAEWKDENDALRREYNRDRM